MADTILVGINDSTPVIQVSISERGVKGDSGDIASSGSFQPLYEFTASIQTEVDSLTAATASYLTNLPSGLISGSEQLEGSTFTYLVITGSFSGSFYGDGSQLSGVTSYTNQDTLNFINSIQVLSGSIDLSQLNAFTGSIQTEVDSLTAVTSSYLTSSQELTLGTDNQIPVMNAAGTDFEYSSIFTYEPGTLKLNNLNDYIGYSFTDAIVKYSDTNTAFTRIQIDTPTSDATINIRNLGGTMALLGDLAPLNNFSSSIQTEVANLTSATGSYLLNTTDTLSGSLTITENLIVTGSILADITGSLQGNASTATTASYVASVSDRLEEDLVVSGSKNIDWNYETFYYNLIADCTFTDINLPSVGSKPITLYVTGSGTPTWPSGWETYINGVYTSGSLNTVVAEYVKISTTPFFKVLISQPD